MATALILAAGGGRRIGGPKALLEIEGQTALARSVAVCHGAGIDDVYVVCGAEADQVIDRHSDLNATFVVNDDWEMGEMLSSLQAGISSFSALPQLLLVHLVDHVLVHPATIRQLLDSTREDAEIIKPVYEGRAGHPVVFSSRVLDRIGALPTGSSPREALTEFVDSTIRFETDDEGVVLDVDSEADLRRVEMVIQTYNEGWRTDL